MERGNTKHSPRQDEQLAHELEGTLQGNRPSRIEEWHNPEPPADDDPEVFRTPESGNVAGNSAETTP
jgi:hypothetical protein